MRIEKSNSFRAGDDVRADGVCAAVLCPSRIHADGK